MKQVTVYQANDGARFDAVGDCSIGEANEVLSWIENHFDALTKFIYPDSE